MTTPHGQRVLRPMAAKFKAWRYERALLLDPGGDLHARPLPRFDIAFRQINGVGSHFGAQSHGPPIRCLRFAGWVPPHHARLAVLVYLARAPI